MSDRLRRFGAVFNTPALLRAESVPAVTNKRPKSLSPLQLPGEAPPRTRHLAPKSAMKTTTRRRDERGQRFAAFRPWLNRNPNNS